MHMFVSTSWLSLLVAIAAGGVVTSLSTNCTGYVLPRNVCRLASDGHCRILIYDENILLLWFGDKYMALDLS